MFSSDLIVAVGTRFSDRATGNKLEFCNGRKVIHIDIDPAEIGKNIPAYVALVGDVKDMLKKLNKNLTKQHNPKWMTEIESLKASPDACLDMDKSRLNPKA